jgi:hypothetical protein
MSKYGAKKTEVDGILFASKLEANRYCELRLLERAGEIEGLELQPVYELQPAFRDATGTKHRAITYVADFRYREQGKVVTEDSKGVLTKEFRLKQKLLLFRYPDIDFRLVGQARATGRRAPVRKTRTDPGLPVAAPPAS